MNTYFNKLVQKSYMLFLAALLVSNTYGADIIGVNTSVISTGTSVGSASACATLVASPVELFSITISGGTGTTNIIATLRDSAVSTQLSSTATYSTMGSFLTNMVRTYTNPYGVSTSVTNYGVQVTYANAAASVTTAKPTVAVLNYTPGTPVTYTFSPPLVFAQGLTITNSQAGIYNTTGLTVTYGYSPAF